VVNGLPEISEFLDIVSLLAVTGSFPLRDELLLKESSPRSMSLSRVSE